MFLLNQSIVFRKNVQGHLPVTAQGHIASLCAYSRAGNFQEGWVTVTLYCIVMSKWLE